MTDEQRCGSRELLVIEAGSSARSRASVMALLLMLVGLSAGCTIASDMLSLMTDIEARWTSTPTQIPDGFVFDKPTTTPTLPAIEAPSQTPTIKPALNVVEAVYLPFENGFMVYVEGASCLYAYAGGPIIPSNVIGTQMPSYMYCLPFDELPQAGGEAPEEPFGRIWSYYEEVPDALGEQVGEAVRYTATIPRSDPVVMGGVFYSGILTLPDGSKLYCGTRAATAGTCEVRSTPLPRP
jgi:hypothetical protein